jgi:hypothetical protein
MQHIGDAVYKRCVIVEMADEEYQAINSLAYALTPNRVPGTAFDYVPVFDLIRRLADELDINNRKVYAPSGVGVTVTKEIKISDTTIAKG